VTTLHARVHDDTGRPALSLVAPSGTVLAIHALPFEDNPRDRGHVQPILDAASALLERRRMTQLAPWATIITRRPGAPLDFRAAITFDRQSA